VRLKLDENLPATLGPALRILGFDADTVLDESLGGEPDAMVWAAAQAEHRFFVTQDLDFSDLRTFRPGTHAGILLIRLPENEHATLFDFVLACFGRADVRTWGGCFAAATPSKVRITRPAGA
jgi:predicted nuclease of predicted toxin-antitoxin system